MNPNLTEKQQALINAIESLPEDKQDIVKWLIANYDIAAAICKTKTLTEAESQNIINHAIQKNDDYLLALAFLERIMNAP